MTEYSIGHPWYYVLNGRILYPSVIKHNAENSEKRGWCERTLMEIDQKAEPASNNAASGSFLCRYDAARCAHPSGKRLCFVVNALISS